MVAGKLIIAGRWIKYKAKTVNTFSISVLKRFKVAEDILSTKRSFDCQYIKQ
jgi:hypothetical protein